MTIFRSNVAPHNIHRRLQTNTQRCNIVIEQRRHCRGLGRNTQVQGFEGAARTVGGAASQGAEDPGVAAPRYMAGPTVGTWFEALGLRYLRVTEVARLTYLRLRHQISYNLAQLLRRRLMYLGLGPKAGTHNSWGSGIHARLV